MTLKRTILKKFLLTLAIALAYSFTFSGYASAQQVQVNPEKEEKTFTMKDPELYQGAKELGLTDEEIRKMDESIEKELQGNHLQNPAFVGVVVDIVAGIVGLGKASYDIGKYAAKQVHKRGVLSKAQYKKHRWSFRAYLPNVLGVPGTLGFDDYYMGI